MGRIALLAALAALVAPTAAHAGTVLVLPDGTERPQPYQSWVDAAHVPTPELPLRLHLETCPHSPGASCVMYPEVELYIDPRRPEDHAGDLRHELGHVADLAFLNDGERNRFRRYIRDLRPWRATGGNSPHEKFAEAYGHCMRSARWPRRDSAYAYEPSPRLHQRICRFIRRAAVR